MKQLGTATLAAGLIALSACQPVPRHTVTGIDWAMQESGVQSSLRGLAVVDSDIAWIGAPDGVVLRTVDGGTNWTRSRIEAAAGLDLRSAHSFDAHHALFFTAGSPARLFETRDGGASFTLLYEDGSDAAFFDGLGFWDAMRGIAFSDPVDGIFHILLTDDGGRSWTTAANLPAPLDGEAGFAASDTGLALGEAGRVWIGTGGAARARILSSPDFGASWGVVNAPPRQRTSRRRNILDRCDRKYAGCRWRRLYPRRCAGGCRRLFARWRSYLVRTGDAPRRLPVGGSVHPGAGRAFSGRGAEWERSEPRWRACLGGHIRGGL